MHAFRWSTFSLLLAQKFQQVKTCFQHLQPKFFQWVHHIYLLALCYSEYVYHVILYHLYLWIKMLMLLIVMGKLDAHFTFIALNEHGPLWLKLWCYELDKCLWLGVSRNVLSHGTLSTLHFIISSWCHALLFMDAYHGEINVEMK